MSDDTTRSPPTKHNAKPLKEVLTVSIDINRLLREPSLEAPATVNVRPHCTASFVVENPSDTLRHHDFPNTL
ncbi:MAG TPA: hypothetical protein DCR20_10365, partial [Planctomycetaceae bacterium]|nr:hypothetical protein [Planctomycetaceae bacterium]